MKKRTLLLTITLVSLLLIISAIFLFFPIGNMGKFSFLLFKKRVLKWLVILLVSLCVSISTISFQTIVQNRFLTPGVLGIESVFVLFQTLVYWGQLSLGMETSPNLWISMFTIVLQMIFFFLIYRAFNDLLSIPFSMLLFICLAFGTLFRSLSTFVQVLMDPNEFDKLQGNLFPSFQRMHHQSELVIIVVILTAISVIYLIRKHMVLNVFHLGKVQAQILGVNVAKEEKWILLVIVLLTSLSTTLVGPMQFLGFMIANVTYQWIKDYRHLQMWTIAFLLGSILLLGGQLVIEKVFQLNIPISVVIEWFGGLLYFVLLLKGRYRSGIKKYS